MKGNPTARHCKALCLFSPWTSTETQLSKQLQGSFFLVFFSASRHHQSTCGIETTVKVLSRQRKATRGNYPRHRPATPDIAWQCASSERPPIETGSIGDGRRAAHTTEHLTF